MAGYRDQVTTLTFPELSEEGDLIWVTIRNPKLMSLEELQPKDVPVDAEGNPIDPAAAQRESYAIMAKLIIGAHVYDATAPIELDETGQVISDMPLLPRTGYTAELIAKLPIEIMNRIGSVMTEAVNPQ